MWKHKTKWLVRGGRKVRCYLCGKKILAEGDLFLFHGDTGYYSHQSCQAESTTISGNERRRAVKKIAVGAAVVGAIAAGAGKLIDISSQSKGLNSPDTQTILTSQGLIPPALTSDPSNPVPGQIWYRSDAGVMAHFDGVQNRVVYSSELDNGMCNVTSKGIINGLSVLPNDGTGWFGPDTTKGATAPGQYGGSFTNTFGAQEAVNYIYNKGGGVVKIMDGMYDFTDKSFQTSNTLSPNATYNAYITIPVNETMSDATGATPITIEISGYVNNAYWTYGPYVNSSNQAVASPPPIQGAIFYSGATGSGTDPCFIGTPQNLTGSQPYNNIQVIGNLTIRGLSPPTINGIIVNTITGYKVYNTNVDVVNSSNFNNQVIVSQPSAQVFGVVFENATGYANSGYAQLENVTVMGYYGGWYIGGNTSIINCMTVLCYFGWMQASGIHPNTIHHVLISQCPVGIYVRGTWVVTGIGIDFQYTVNSNLWYNMQQFIKNGASSTQELYGDLWVAPIESGESVNPQNSVVVSSPVPITLRIHIISQNPVSPTIPANPPVSGTTYQNANPYDIRLKIPVTYSPTSSAAATLATGISSTSTVTTSTKVSYPAGITTGIVETYEMVVKAGQYFELVVTNATIGTVEVQAA